MTQSELRRVLSRNVKRVAMERGIALVDLPRLAGISERVFASAMGDRRFTLDTLAAIARALGVDADELMRPLK